MAIATQVLTTYGIELKHLFDLTTDSIDVLNKNIPILSVESREKLLTLLGHESLLYNYDDLFNVIVEDKDIPKLTSLPSLACVLNNLRALKKLRKMGWIFTTEQLIIAARLDHESIVEYFIECGVRIVDDVLISVVINKNRKLVTPLLRRHLNYTKILSYTIEDSNLLSFILDKLKFIDYELHPRDRAKLMIECCNRITFEYESLRILSYGEFDNIVIDALMYDKKAMTVLLPKLNITCIINTISRRQYELSHQILSKTKPKEITEQLYIKIIELLSRSILDPIELLHLLISKVKYNKTLSTNLLIDSLRFDNQQIFCLMCDVLFPCDISSDTFRLNLLHVLYRHWQRINLSTLEKILNRKWLSERRLYTLKILSRTTNRHDLTNLLE